MKLNLEEAVDLTVTEIIGKVAQEIFSKVVPRTRKVGGKPLSADVGISITASSPLTVTNNSDASNVAFALALDDSGVTAGNKGDTANQTPGFGGVFKVLSATVDAKGRLTALEEHSVAIPNAEATTSTVGLMSAEDKNKLSGIEPQANKTLIDDTMSNAGQAADAKATGDAFAALKTENALLKELINGIDAPIYRTASGNPATFSDGYAANVKDLIVTIAPAQEGEGDPSPDNVRPISGVESVSVTRTGKNLLPATSLSGVLRRRDGYTVSALTDGAISVTGTLSAATLLLHNMFDVSKDDTTSQYDFKKWLPNGRYKLLAERDSGVDARIQIMCYNTAPNFDLITPSVQSGAVSFEITDKYQYNFARLYLAAGTYDNLKIYPRVYRDGLDITAFEPYRGQTVSVSMGDAGTVYGGTLNVTTGELTVKYMRKHIDGNTSFNVSATTGYAFIPLGFRRNFSDNALETCSLFPVRRIPTKKWIDSLPGYINVIDNYDGSSQAAIVIDGLTTEDEYREWFANHEFDYVVSLANPTAYALTPAQLATLSGYNAVSTDAETLSVEYRADPSLSLGGG